MFKEIKNYFLLNFLACLSAILFVSCEMAIFKDVQTQVKSFLGSRLNLKINISEKANINNPIAVDILIVYDDKLLAQLLKMNSREWFQNKEQFKRDYLQGMSIDFWEWEWTPGQIVPNKTLPIKSKAKGGLVFANYYTLGTHRASINPSKDITIEFLENNFNVKLGNKLK